jgi:hypothetical protein
MPTTVLPPCTLPTYHLLQMQEQHCRLCIWSCCMHAEVSSFLHSVNDRYFSVQNTLYHCFMSQKIFGFFAQQPPPPQWVMASSFTRFLDHTQRRITFGRTPLDEWSARLKDLYLTTHNTHNRQTYMPPAGFEHTISAGAQSYTYAKNRAATETGMSQNTKIKLCKTGKFSGCLMCL